MIDEAMNVLNWKEKIIVKFFAKTYKKVYNIARIKIVNSMLNN